MSLPFQSLMGQLPFMDGPLPQFPKLDDKFKCVKCKKMLQYPLQTPCGHRICASCRDELLGENNEAFCPGGDEFCQEERIMRDNTFPDMALIREMSRLQVYCEYKQYGCDAIMPWNKLEAHKAKCEYAAEPCPYSTLGCKEAVPLKNMESHKSCCQYQPRSCEYCNDEVAMVSLDGHISLECPCAPIPCPYKCGEQSIIRSQLDEHKIVCQAKPQECKFKVAGCKFMGSAEEIAEHEVSAPEHLDMLVMQLTRTRRQLLESEELREEQSQKIAELEKQNVTMKKRVDYCEMKCNKIETTIAPKIAAVIAMEESSNTQQTTVTEHSRQLTAIQDIQQQHERKIANMERNGVGSGASPELNTKVVQMERQVSITDVRLAEMDQRFQCLETTSYDGTLVWKIGDYTRRKQDAVNSRILSLYSQPFYTNRFGYKMCLRVYLNGDGMGKGSHLSLFFVIMRGEYDCLLPWPFRQKVTLTLMDLEKRSRHLTDTFRPDPSSTSFQLPQSEMNIASGCPLFVAHSVLETNTYLQNDTLFIKCNVESMES